MTTVMAKLSPIINAYIADKEKVPTPSTHHTDPLRFLKKSLSDSDSVINYKGLSRNQGVRTCLFSRTATNLLTYLCSRLEWFRFNESTHVMVKQKTLATDLSRILGFGEKQFPIKSTYLHACFFATFCIDSPLSITLFMRCG